MLEWIAVILALWIQDGNGRRHHFVRDVMITDDEINSKAFGVCYFVNCLDAAIQNNNQFNTRFLCMVYSLFAHTVALIVAIGDIIIDVGIELLQELIHQCDGRTAIHIVITIHHNALFASHGVVQSVYG